MNLQSPVPMIQKAALFCFLLLISVRAYSQEVLEGEFEFNKTLNEYITLNKKEKKLYDIVMNNLDIPFVDNYLQTLDRGETRKADSLLKTSKVFRKVPPKAVATFYTMHQVHQAGLGEMYCITLKSAMLQGVTAIFVTKEQYKKLKPRMSKPMTLNVKFIAETKGTGVKLYKLIA